MRHLKYGFIAAFCVVMALGAWLLMGQDNSTVAPEDLLLNEKQGIASNAQPVTPVATPTPAPSGDELPAELGGMAAPPPAAVSPAEPAQATAEESPAVTPVAPVAAPAEEALPSEVTQDLPKEVATPEVPVAPVAADAVPAAEALPAEVTQDLPKEVTTPEVPAAPVAEDAAPAAEALPAEVTQDLTKEVTAPLDAGEKPVVESGNIQAPAEAQAPLAEAPLPAVADIAPAAPVAGAVPAEAGLQPSDKNTEYFKGRTKVAESLAAREEVRRKANAEEAKKLIEKADAAMKARDYETAYTNFIMIRNAFQNSVENRELVKRANKNITISQFEIVKSLAKENKNAQALDLSKAYLNENPDNAPLIELSKKLEKKVEQIKIATDSGTGAGKVVVPGKTPIGANKSDVQLLLKAGKDYLGAREFDKAKAQFEAVLALEPANKDAIKYLGEVARRRMKTGLLERESTTKGMVADVTKTWNPPDYKEIKPPPTKEISKPDTQAQAIIKKMAEITIPEIEFRQANIHDVVEFLNKASMEGDKSAGENGPRGINIILKIKGAGAAQPAVGGDNAGGFPGGDGAGDAAANAGGVPPITFTARYISLAEALNIITSVAGLKYRVEGRVVMVVDGTDEPRDMILRMYPVEPTFIEKVTTIGPMRALGTSGTEGGNFVSGDASGGGGAAAGGDDLKDKFIGMGVPFPQGSSIQYNSGIGQVIVANTTENLTKFEALLSVLNVIPQQVEIEARFVEINETELEELGVEWLLSDNWEMMQKKNTAFGTPLSATERIQMNKNSSDGGFTKGLRFWGNSSSGDEETMMSGSKGRLLSISSILTNPELTFVLHALEQKGHADVLSAPKVTTRSGVEASIRVVTEFIYPTTFDVQSGSDAGNNNNNTGAAVVQQNTFVSIPQDFETREVGVILTVMPEVSPNGGTINLTMTPQVVTEPTWQQYGSVIRHADGTEDVLNMPQPFFHTRTLTTQISIYDGATVVMGGLITETLQTVDDKIPLLGDIPLLGHLFSTTSQKSEKKNLLIFVTASLVDPGGKRIKKSDDLGAALMGPANPNPQAAPTP
jgi:general secretion pathway protein D